MDSRPLILHVIFRLDYGGLENGLVNLINRMPADAFRHAIVCLAGFTEFRDRLRRSDVQVYTLDKKPGKDPGMYARFGNLLRKLRPAVVHTRNLGTLDLQYVAFASGVSRRVHGEHGWGATDPRGLNRKNLLIRRACRPVVQRYVTVSRDLARWLESSVGVARRRITQIYNGVDTERFTPEGSVPADLPWQAAQGTERVVFGTVGRLDPIKNQGMLIEATAELVNALPGARARIRVLIAGDGGMADALQEKATQAGVADLVWFAGARNDIPELLRAMDVFVLPSLNEGISNTVLEAMASARPILASSVGGNPELIEAGRTGMLFAPTDRAALVQAMAWYCQEPARGRALGAAARERVIREFSLEAMIAGYFELYRELCSTPIRQYSVSLR